MFAQGSDKCVLVCSMPSHAHSISDVQSASNEIGVFNPSPWNSPRVRALKGWEARNDGGGRLFAIGFRSNLCKAVALWRLPRSRSAESLQPPSSSKSKIIIFSTWDLQCNLLAKDPRRASNQSWNLPTRFCSGFASSSELSNILTWMRRSSQACVWSSYRADPCDTKHEIPASHPSVIAYPHIGHGASRIFIRVVRKYPLTCGPSADQHTSSAFPWIDRDSIRLVRYLHSSRQSSCGRSFGDWFH